MNPKVSILIPVHNRKRYIVECIQSALEQTFTDFEIVIVDNASDDGTWEICKQFAAKDSRIRIYQNEENIGPVRNWKRCAEEAQGEFSKILFSDDQIEDNCLEEMVRVISKKEVGFVYCSAKIGSSKLNASLKYHIGNSRTLSRKNYIELLIDGDAPVSPGAIILRTAELIKNLDTNFPSVKPQSYNLHGAGPDVMIMLKTSLNYNLIEYIGTPLVFFRMHENSITIANRNHEVQESYVSAISYHLHSNREWILWSRYVAKSWLHKMKIKKKWINVRVFICQHEGCGSLLEILMVLKNSILIVNKFLWKKFLIKF